MNDIEQINDLFDEVYQGLKDDIFEKDVYGCRLFLQPPNNSYLPNVQMYNENKYLGEETLDYQERRYPIEFKVEIYAEDTTVANKFIITSVIESVVASYMRKQGFKIQQSRPILNLDTNVRRVLMRFTALYDIENKIVYKR